VDHLTDLAIALLFFVHGAKLSREAVIAAASHFLRRFAVPRPQASSASS
jgi:predicted Na+-dependent transporter